MAIFWVALFDLLSSMEIWHAQAATVSGRGTSPTHTFLLIGDAFWVCTLVSTLGRRGALAVPAQRRVRGVIWTPQKGRITLYTCFYFLIRGSSIRPCWSHSSCSGNLQSKQKRVALKAVVPDMLRSYVLPKAL